LFGMSFVPVQKQAATGRGGRCAGTHRPALGTDDEDPDLLAMVESYEELQEYMCRRCYEYGKLGLRPARRGGQKGKAPVAQRRAPEPNEKSRPCAR
jgi:hypothetical protein